jgi:hypothetical protein
LTESSGGGRLRSDLGSSRSGEIEAMDQGRGRAVRSVLFEAGIKGEDGPRFFLTYDRMYRSVYFDVPRFFLTYHGF